MKVFLLDLWLDLRQKRLAPVAIALLAGIIAVPIALSKGSAEEAAPPQPAASAAAAAATPLVSGAQAAQAPSDLGVFSPKNPFTPVGGAATGGGGTSGGTGGGGATGGGASTTGGTTTTTGTATTTLSSGGGGGGATQPPPSGPAPSSGTPTGTTSPTKPKITFFTYAATLRFGACPDTGRCAVRDLKRYADVKRLRGLPSNRNPLIVFLGSPPSGTSAVFLIDSERFSVSGEGDCSPSGDRCTFLRLRARNARNDAVLTDVDTGATYRLRLTGIRRVAINSSAGSRSTEGGGGGGGRGGGNRTPAFTGSAGGSGSAAPLPYFADGASG